MRDTTSTAVMGFLRPFKFMQLPGEIRNMILRQLLKSPEPLLSRERFRSGNEQEDTQAYAAQVSLSSQIMRCCKHLYHEGSHILYGQNTLAVELGDSCNILDTSTKLCAPFCELRDYARTYGSSPTDQLITIYPKLLLFQKIVVDAKNLWEDRTAWTACRAISGLVKDKDVVVVPYEFDGDGRYGLSDWLKACGGWRCHSIRFKDAPSLDGTRLASPRDIKIHSPPLLIPFYDAELEKCIVDTILQLKHGITSNEPPQDLFSRARQLHDILDQATSLDGGSIDDIWIEPSRQDPGLLWDAVCQYDVVLFEERRSALLATALVHTDRRYRQEKTRLEQDYAGHILKNQERYKEQVNDRHHNDVGYFVGQLEKKKVGIYRQIGKMLIQEL